MLLFSPSVMIATNGQEPTWDSDRAGWLKEYQVLIRQDRISMVEHDEGQLRTSTFEQGDPLKLDAAFTTRGDVYHNDLAEHLGASIDREGEIIVDACLKTSVAGLYAAGCVTAANCQMIIAAGQGAIAGKQSTEICSRKAWVGIPYPVSGNRFISGRNVSKGC